ncbi:AAA family ATPase [Pseudonocardia yuanmonensis]|uniref:AAA family ATPase n=1 Tax=Pseudonocardia yuanmonensis TaxID=1095914 RepID=UPI003CD0607A
MGRGEQMAELRTLLADARGGRGGVVAVVGEPGVGKSRLAREALAVAAQVGVVALSGRAAPSAGPFRALTNAFLSYGRRHRFPSTPQLEPFRGALAVLVPDWGVAAEGRTPATSIPLIGEGLLRLLRVAAAASGTRGPGPLRRRGDRGAASGPAGRVVPARRRAAPRRQSGAGGGRADARGGPAGARLGGAGLG